MNERGFVLREYRAADAGAVEDVWVAAWVASGIPIDFEARRPWFAAELARLAWAGAEIVVGRDAGGRVAGVVTIDVKTGELHQLCVAPSAWGGGLARALLGEAKRRAPRGIELDVNTDNSRACRFYAREGFVAAGQGTNSLSGLATRRMRWPGNEPERA